MSSIQIIHVPLLSVSSSGKRIQSTLPGEYKKR